MSNESVRESGTLSADPTDTPHARSATSRVIARSTGRPPGTAPPLLPIKVSLQFVAVQPAGVVAALRPLAAGGNHVVVLCARLDAFDDDGQTELLSDCDYPAEHDRAVVRPAETRNELLVDLDESYR